MSETIFRYQIADYLNVGTEAQPEYVLMGVGFNSLDENPSAQTDGKIYIHEKSQTNYIKSYQTTFAFDTDLVADEQAVMLLYHIGRNQLTGADAELDYVRVELFEAGSTNTYKARKFKVSVEVSSISGVGGDVVKVTGNLNGVGDFIDGTFRTDEKIFTEN